MDKSDETLSEFIKHSKLMHDHNHLVYKNQWRKALSKKLVPGTPRLIYLASSAIRAIQVIKLFKPLGSFKIAKLFAKHIKMQDQIAFLKNQKSAVAVGTPNRVLKLIQGTPMLD